jgi:hypothetical protein
MTTHAERKVMDAARQASRQADTQALAKRVRTASVFRMR